MRNCLKHRGDAVLVIYAMSEHINDNSANNKRIAKNTILLYGRMLFMMIISLYTSRVVLNALGVDDYGIYNVVGGVVSMFAILSGSLSAAISRFITFALGKGDKERIQKVFSTAINVQIILIVIISLLLETLGLWFLNYKMVIPADRLVAANWVFQFSIITFAVNLWSIPYNATIVAHECMSAFAYISIFDAIAKLFIAFLILMNPIDRLIFYGSLVLLVGLIQRSLYARYCKKHFEECKWLKELDKNLMKEMFSFAGWNFFGAGSWQLMTQGVNILLNVFFGVVVNAARGIAVIVDSTVVQFVTNFTTAINPQITKSYASGEKEYMFSLMFRGAKFSFFLVMFFAFPIIFETDFILKIWLGDVPEHTVSFVRLALMVSMLHVLSNTMITAMLATGNIKKYQIIVGGLGMLVFPLALLFFYLGFPPEAAYVATLIIFVAQLVCRLRLINQMTGMSVPSFLSEVLCKVFFVSVPAFIIPYMFVEFMDNNAIRFVVVCASSVSTSILAIWALGLSHEERLYSKKLLFKLINKVR